MNSPNWAQRLPYRLALTRSFRYLRGVLRATSVSSLGLALAAAALGGLLGCSSRAKTAEEAYARFAAAVTASDGAALFDVLDQPTRWAYLSLQKYHREAYDIILSNYPPGSARERDLHRFQKGATATSGRELFRTEVLPGVLPTLTPLAAAGATVQGGPAPNEAAAVLPSGQRVPLGKGEDGSWGFSGLRAQAEDQKNRAYHDLEVVRASAADYERAAARAAK
jgi:hypothetical protein